MAALDELYLWLSNPVAIEYIRNCLKRVRKRDSALIMASQNLEDFDQEGVREMTNPLFAIPPHQFLFNPGSIGKRFYMDMLQLDEAEFELIQHARRGEGLVKCGMERSHLEVKAPPHKAALFGTLILSPLIILAAFLCCFGDGASRHNNAVVSAAFYGAAFSDKVPKEYRTHITEMQEAFSLLDSATVYVNQKAEEGSLDPVQVKAVFFALCFGDNAPTRAAAGRFVDCFYKTETRTRMVTVTQEDGTEELVEETYEVAVPLPMAEVYEKLSIWRGRVVTDAERSNAVDIYVMVMGSMGGDTFNGAYEPGGSAPIELDVSMLTDPTTKNAADLVTYVTNAWNSGWGYVWGTYGQTLTPELLQYKLTQYPDSVGKYAVFIRANWLGKHTADCVGLIKGYGWLSTDTMTIDYGTHGMPDIGANEMYYDATQRGSIDTMPDTPGLAVWKSGHIGVYIGNGEVIEAMGTKYGVVKTQLEGRGWTHWLEVPGIEYE